MCPRHGGLAHVIVRLMLRKTLTILSLLGLLLSVGLWGVSYWRVDYQGRYALTLTHGCLVLGKWWEAYMKGWSHSGFSSIATTWIPSWSFKSEHGLGYYHAWHLVIPLWMPTLLCVIATGFLCIPPIRQHCRRKRKKLGLCVKCGYDLRGSKDRCPECGEEFGSTGVVR